MSTIGNYSRSNPYNPNVDRRPPPPRHFEKADMDGNGSLDANELEAMAKDISAKTGRTVTAQDLLQRLDQDGDGSVSRAEHAAGRPKGPPPGMDPSVLQSAASALQGGTSSGPSSLEDLFQYLDANGGSAQSRADMQAMVRQRLQLLQTRV